MIRTLIVDDSPTMRAILHLALKSDPEIVVVGEAPNAMEARTRIKELDPDVITLDIEMPGMSGIDFLEKIMTLRPMPVVIISGTSVAGSAATLRALELGAFECIAKPKGNISHSLVDFSAELIDVVKAAAQNKAHLLPMRNAAPSAAPAAADRAAAMRRGPPSLIAIGASTGGIEALHRLLPQFPTNCPPTLVVQHINAAFAKGMAETLNNKCPARVKLAESGEKLETGTIYIAPESERHLVLGSGDRLSARMAPGDKVAGHRPSVDRLFASVAERVGARATGILLTGMGADGANGLLAMKQSGAHTIAQNEATCTVFGMPRAAIELGAVTQVLGLDRIATAVFP